MESGMKDKKRFSRRTLLVRACQVIPSATTLLLVGGCGNRTAVCADPNELSVAENSLRTAAHFTEESPDPQKVCAGCAFFHPSADSAQCGHCDIFNGPANAGGHCDSWSQKT